MIYDIRDPTHIKEVDYLETINQFMDTEKFVNTGFTLKTSKSEYENKYENVIDD